MDLILHGLPTGNFVHYVSSTYLNGIVNYTTPVLCYLTQRYRPSEELNDQVVQEKLKELKTTPHTNLGIFGDDVWMIGKIDLERMKYLYDEDYYKEYGSENEYVFFWFDQDVSDCSVGRFKTSDSLQTIKEELLKDLSEKDRYIKNFWEVPVDFIQGWVSF